MADLAGTLSPRRGKSTDLERGTGDEHACGFAWIASFPAHATSAEPRSVRDCSIASPETSPSVSTDAAACGGSRNGSCEREDSCCRTRGEDLGWIMAGADPSKDGACRQSAIIRRTARCLTCLSSEHEVLCRPAGGTQNKQTGFRNLDGAGPAVGCQRTGVLLGLDPSSTGSTSFLAALADPNPWFSVFIAVRRVSGSPFSSANGN